MKTSLIYIGNMIFIFGMLDVLMLCYQMLEIANGHASHIGWLDAQIRLIISLIK